MKKQIILLMTDTTRKDMVGCYGNKKMFTPNLDALAQEGIRYENAYTCQPVCGPARSAIFTGTFPHSNGMVTNGVPLGANVTASDINIQHHRFNFNFLLNRILLVAASTAYFVIVIVLPPFHIDTCF